MPFVVTPSLATDLEHLTLDGLDLNDGLVLRLINELSCPPPRQRQEWIGAADSEWQTLVRNPLHENRQITATVEVVPTSDMDAALGRVGQIVDKLQSASQTEDGIPLVWQPAGSTVQVTFDVLAGQITEMPINVDNGWFVKKPQVTIVMDAKPYWHGTETLTSTVSSSTPVTTMEIVNAVGDVPALGRLIVTDTATQSRRHVEWGLEGPTTYNPATSLFLHADNCLTGFAGVRSTATGAYDPNTSGHPVIFASLFTTPVVVCGTGNLTHEGVFRVKARVFSSGAMHRLTWHAGDGPNTSNAWTTGVDPPDVWREVDLGTITIPAGSGKWTGTVEAYAPANTGYITRLNYLEFIPVTAGYGKARGVFSYTAGAVSGYDYFTGTTAGGNLNGRGATAGGVWATSGSTTDLQFADDLGDEQVKRSTTSDTGPRFAILGSTTFTDTEVAVKVMQNTIGGNPVDLGAIARWVDSANYLRATLTKNYVSAVLSLRLVVEQVVASTATVLATVDLPNTSATQSNTWTTVRLLAYTSGRVVAQLLDSTGTIIKAADVTSSAVATGGALASGKPGIYDRNQSALAITRWYDDFTVSTPAAEPVVIYSGRNIEIRHDDTIRQDAAGTYTGRPSSYRGSRFLVPPGTSRVLAAARRNDIDATTSDYVTDSTQIQVAVTPRGLVVPRD